MKNDCAKAAKQPYDWIVIMGGTNDLGWGQPPEVIFENLSKCFGLYHRARHSSQGYCHFLRLGSLTLFRQSRCGESPLILELKC